MSNEAVEILENPDEYLKTLTLVSSNQETHPTASDVLPPVEIIENEEEYLSSLKGSEITGTIVNRDTEASAIQNFFNRSVADVSKRVDKTKQSLDSARSFEDATLAVVGQGVAGSVLDVAGNLFGLAADAVKVIIPDDVEEAVAAQFSEGLNAVLTDPRSGYVREGLEVASKGYKAYDEWANKNKAAALKLESVFNIAAFFNPAKVKGGFKLSPDIKPTTPPVVANKAFQTAELVRQLDKTDPKKAQVLRTMATGLDKSADETLQDYALSITLPKETKKVMEKQVERTITNPLGTNKYQPTPYELEMAQEVAKSGIVRSRNIQKNYNIIKDKINKEAATLSQNLAKYDKQTIPRSYVESKIVANTVDKLEGNVFIRGNTQLESIVENLHNKLFEVLQGNPSTPRGLLESRQQLDKIVKSQLGKVAFQNDTNKTMLMEVIKGYRTSINEMIEEAVPDVKVLESLRKQSLKFSALDNMRPKAAEQASTAIGRLWSNVQSVVGAKRDTNVIAAGLLGAGAMTAATQMLPYLAGGITIAAVGAAAVKGATSPTMKRSLAKLLRLTDKAIEKTTDPEQVASLKMDRVALIELLKLPVQPEEKEEQ